MGEIRALESTHVNNRRQQRLALATVVLLLAAGLRLWRLSEVPPGQHHDEAFHLLSAQAIAAGARPVYITGNQGNDPLFAYLSALTVTLLEGAPWAGRLLAAWVGLLTVALTLRLGQAMFPGRSVGLWAGLALAGLYWHLSMSRWGSQPVLASAAAAGTMLGLWRGARSGRRGGYVLAGFSLAAGLWSYVAFRLFPIIPLAAGLAWLAAGRGRRRQLLAGGLLAGALALVLYAPLGLYFLQHPEWFFHRYTQISVLAAPTPGGTLARLAEHTVDVTAGLVLPGRGDQDWRQNLPGRPAFDVVQALLFALGGWLVLRRSPRPAAVALGAWVVIGLLPAVLTEFPPQFGRTVMVTPALALLIGCAADALWTWAHSRAWLRLGLAVAVAGSLFVTARDYFVRWGGDEHLFIAFDAGLRAVSEALGQSSSDAALYMTPIFREYPTLEYALGPQAYGRLRAFNGRACLVLPADARGPAAYGVIVAEDGRTLPALTAAFPDGSLRSLADSAGRPYAAVFTIPAGQTAHLPEQAAGAPVFGDLLRLRAHTGADSPLPSGQVLELTLTWELTAPTAAALTSFVHVLGPGQAGGAVLYAQRDRQPCDNAYPTWQWQPGELLTEYVSLPLPPDMPPGRYSLNVGWYDSVSQARLPLTGPTARADASAGSLQIGTLVVTAP